MRQSSLRWKELVEDLSQLSFHLYGYDDSFSPALMSYEVEELSGRSDLLASPVRVGALRGSLEQFHSEDQDGLCERTLFLETHRTAKRSPGQGHRQRVRVSRPAPCCAPTFARPLRSGPPGAVTRRALYPFVIETRVARPKLNVAIKIQACKPRREAFMRRVSHF